jgi:hypothetical protein
MQMHSHLRPGIGLFPGFPGGTSGCALAHLQETLGVRNVKKARLPSQHPALLALMPAPELRKQYQGVTTCRDCPQTATGLDGSPTQEHPALMRHDAAHHLHEGSFL